MIINIPRAICFSLRCFCDNRCSFTQRRGRRVKRRKRERERKRVSVCERVMKRQSSAVSPSSSRRETPPEKLQAKTIGCMSGILHFISSSNARRSRRFLTFGAFRFAFFGPTPYLFRSFLGKF